MTPSEIIANGFPLTDVILEDPPSTLTEGELHVIADLLTNPIIKRYFHTLLWNQLREVASTPISELDKPDSKYKHAYMKGCIGMLLTLSSIEQPAATKARKTNI